MLPVELRNGCGRRPAPAGRFPKDLCVEAGQVVARVAAFTEALETGFLEDSIGRRVVRLSASSGRLNICLFDSTRTFLVFLCHALSANEPAPFILQSTAQPPSVGRTSCARNEPARSARWTQLTAGARTNGRRPSSPPRRLQSANTRDRPCPRSASSAAEARRPARARRGSRGLKHSAQPQSRVMPMECSSPAGSEAGACLALRPRTCAQMTDAYGPRRDSSASRAAPCCSARST